MNEEDFILELDEKPKEWRQVVRVTTRYWSDRRGIYMRKSLLFMKRKSFGYNVLKEDSSNMGADEVVPRILNLNEVEDGLYELYVVNEVKDWETGCVEEWDYKLFPYTEEVAS
jgi:hypothetical protein